MNEIQNTYLEIIEEDPFKFLKIMSNLFIFSG